MDMRPKLLERLLELSKELFSYAAADCIYVTGRL